MSHKIIRKEKLSAENFLFEIEARNVSERFKAGQFVIIRLHDRGERIPLTVAEVNPDRGSVTLIFQVVGKTTAEMSQFNVGDSLANVVGPLGNPTHIDKFGQVICVGGGTGIACIYPIVKALATSGNKVISILGARTKSLLLLETEMRSYCFGTFITTDDGSKGRKGFVTDVLAELIEEYAEKGGLQRVFAIGPPLMMKSVAEVTRPFDIQTIVSLNTIMIDGTGMCGSCRVFIDGKMKLACIDGPEFDAHKVNFDDVISRLSMFQKKEADAMNAFIKKKGGKPE
jgi:NAD(P)H-flavin reductase